ncbi:YcnI family protein [Viridibacterium curvum]|uniref:YcnI family protein n=1 Tax=Viridibacterium curvum TaxID=1101404 RepID=A0ABP9R758_9RHOO
MFKSSIAALVCAAFAIPMAHAHVTLEQQSAVANSNYKAVFRVGHGCAGSPTTSVTVFLPAGFVGGKPMPKAGWKLDVKTEKLDKPYDSHGTLVTERAAQFTWSGGRLLDAEYDEFVVRVTLPAEPGKRWIRVLQQCEQGQNDWASVPVEGQPRPAFPPAQIEILPAAPTPSATAVAGPHAHH